MSDRTVQMAVLVVLIAILVIGVVRLVVVGGEAGVPLAAALIGLASTAIGGLMLLISRPANSAPPPKAEPTYIRPVDSEPK